MYSEMQKGSKWKGEEELYEILEQVFIWDALLDLVPFEQFKKVKNTHGDVLHIVKLEKCYI